MKKDYSLISFILRGVRRKAVLEALTHPKTPKEIAQECKISTSNVSNSLMELKDRELVDCITPEAHFCRFYKITKKGKELFDNLTLT